MKKHELQRWIESFIFLSPKITTKQEVINFVSKTFGETELTDKTFDIFIEDIKLKYESEDSIMQLVEISEGYKFLGKEKYSPILEHLYAKKKLRKLSRSAMETLSVIAYKSPATKNEVEFIRGVNSDYSVERLLDRGLIRIMGKADLPGKPLMYGIGENFLEHLGLKSVEDLPKLKDMEFIEANKDEA